MTSCGRPNTFLFMSAEWRELKVGRYAGTLDAALCTPGNLDALARLGELVSSPSALVVADGRNRHVRLTLDEGGRPCDVLVKSFGRESPFKNWLDARRGSKARRTWSAACRLAAAGVGTPRPLGYLEYQEGGRLRESYYLAHYLSDAVSFTGELNHLLQSDPECWKFMALLQSVADAIRGMHAAGVQHNDLGNQNILMRRAGDGRWEDVCFIDLNRSRILPELTLRQRARDISRIYLPGDFLRVFKEMYFGDVPPAEFHHFEERYRRAYAWHSRTRRYRHPVRTLRRALAGGDHRTYPLERDMWVWDERSAQAINVMRSRERRREHRVADHLRTGAVVASGAARVAAEYRRLLAECYGAPVKASGRIGVAVEPLPGTFDREVELLNTLGRIPVLIRFYHHAGDARREFAARALKALRQAGYPVSIALVQSRRAVADPADWARFVGRVLDDVGGLAEFVEVGHAVNRVKWGIWESAEHRRLLQAAADAGAGHPGLRWIGPAAIDFEYHSLMAALRNVPPGMRFAALSHHLYVDRRGAPENAQGAYTALHKFALARAIGRWSGCCDDRLIVSEVNWPLTGMGVYSPVGSPYVSPGPRFNDPSVSEDDYADYMLRYLLIAIASGMVERVYWWRLTARGFGLVDDSDPSRLRPRPAFEMLRVALQRLEGAVFREVRGRKPGLKAQDGVPPWTCFAFYRADGSRFGIAYSATPWSGELPFPCGTASDALGRELPEVRGLGGRPLYLELSLIHI